jgi:thioredoxin 1
VKDKQMKKAIRFTATWCGPCKMLAKNLESVKTETPIEVIDIDENSELATKFGIRGVPTLVMLQDDVETKRLVGMKPLKELEDWLND